MSGEAGLYRQAQELSRAGKTRAALALCRRACRREPAWPCFHLLCELELAEGRAKPALEALAETLRLEPDSASLRRWAAHLLRDLDEAESALREIGAAVRLEPENLDAHALKCAVELDLGRRSEALRTAAGMPRTAAGLLAAGEFFLREGSFDEAETRFRDALRLDPRSLPALESLLQLSVWQGRAKEALRLCAAALAADPKSPRALRTKAAALVLQGRFLEAAKAATEAPGDREALVWRGEARRRMGQWAKARIDLESALAGLPAQDRPLGGLINLALLRSERGESIPPEEASAIFNGVGWRHIGVSAPTAPPPRMMRRALRLMKGNRGSPATMSWTPRENRRSGQRLHYSPRVATMALQAAVRFGDLERVLAEFDRLMSSHPREPYAPASRGEVLLWAGRYEQAAADIRRSLRLEPNQPWPAVGLAGVAVMRGEFGKALALLGQAERRPSPAGILATWRGEAYRKLGQPKRALAELAKGVDPFPFRPSLWINAALAKGAAGDRKGEAELFRRLRRRLPDFFAEAARLARSGRPRRVLEKALELMKGNRSSWMYTYVLPSGRIKHIKIAGISPESAPPAFAPNRWMFSRASRPTPA